MTPTGKVDRIHLPPPNFDEISKSLDDDRSLISSLEEKLSTIITETFGLTCSPSSLNIDATFAELGASSLGIIKALSLIRQQKLAGSHSV
ncbi:unnamed protein product, partial [Rotaria sordida]